MPSLFSGEVGLHRLQAGKEGTRFSPATVDTLFPADAATTGALDRGYMSPNEDYGVLALHQPARGIWGVRLATLPFRSVGLYEYMPIHLGAGIEGGVAASHPTTGVDLLEFVRDMTGDSLDSYTFEEGDNNQVFQYVGSMIRQARYSFSSLVAPGNVPLGIEAEYFAQDKASIADFTPGAVAVEDPEAIVGQTARIYIGSPTTAFDSLPEVLGLLAADVTVPSGSVPRKYGSADDTYTHVGKVKAAPTGTLTVYETDDTTTDVWDIFDDPDASAKHMRVRLEWNGRLITGSYYYRLRFDGHVAFTSVPIGNDGNGARVYQAACDFVYDDDLASDFRAELQIPTP